MAIGDNYKHYIPDIKLSIERNTRDVPNDDCYYIVRDGKIIDKSRTLKKAKEVFDKMVKESGFKPKVERDGSKDLKDYALDQYFLAKEVYWAESYKHRGRGGKGGRGGI
jgi:hypothetical protein